MKDSAPVIQMTSTDVKQQLFLSEEQIRKYPQFKDATPEDIINIINSLHQLSLITYALINKEIDNQAEINQAA